MSKQTQNQPSATAIKFANTIVQQLDVLSTKREQWEATAYKKATDELYSLLADCLSIYLDKFQHGSDSDKKALRVELFTRLKANGVGVVKTSTTLTMLARYVFNSDRKRALGYGYVIAAAVSHGVGAKEFADWVRQCGGIEEIKRKMVKSSEALAKRDAVAAATEEVKGAMELAALQPLAHVQLDGVGTGAYTVLLAKPNPNGGADIIATLADVNDALVNSLVQRMAKSQVKAAMADDELTKQVNAETNNNMFAQAKNEAQAMEQFAKAA
jgi:hypothetical protein